MVNSDQENPARSQCSYKTVRTFVWVVSGLLDGCPILFGKKGGP